MYQAVRRRIERANWELSTAQEAGSDRVRDGGNIVFDVIQAAVFDDKVSGGNKRPKIS
jgi:hypothetical protein